MSLPGGRIQPFGFTEVFAVVMPLPTAVPLLYAPVLYGWMARGRPWPWAAWALGIVVAAGMFAAGTRVRD
ncbi:hypothetical protein ABT224_37850 [Streptomyces sp. NPDC001584]|uniref:hypothetical protein n=1 Tax=Streptomyces sp. NPDC001584 TaxID=3154521 RepID=UPI003317446F